MFNLDSLRVSVGLLALALSDGTAAQGVETASADSAKVGDASGDEASTAGDGEEIVVTGRAGAGQRTKLDTSYAITTMSDDFLRTRAPSSVTEALKSVPGFWVEASGGEGSGNVRARGIPVDGFGSVNLLLNGLPVQHDPALGYLNVDQTFRIDETIQRVEVVRGGPSSIFTPNAPGGVINFITRRATDAPQGIAKFTYGPTADQERLDLWFGAPVAGFTVGAGGFYRTKDGVRDPGFRGNKGGQFRIDVGRDLGDGRIDLAYRRLDDRTIFYTGIPLTRDASGDIVGVPGFDPLRDTLASPATAHLALKNGTGGTGSSISTIPTARGSSSTSSAARSSGASATGCSRTRRATARRRRCATASIRRH